MHRQRVSIVERLLHVAPHERRRVVVFWSATVVLEMVIATSWTVLLALFIGRQGIERLDLLYAAHAVFSILGTFFFSSWFKRVTVERLLFVIGGGAAAAFVLSTFFASWSERDAWRVLVFFTIYFFAYSYLLTRMVALHATLTYNRLGAAEAERLGPIIESAYPVGDLLAGSLIFSLAQVFSVASLILFIVPLLLIFLLLWWHFLYRGWKSPQLRSRSDAQSEVDAIPGPLPVLGVVLRDKFLMCMAILTLLQGLTYDLVEYQYASVVSDHAVVLLPKVFRHEDRQRVRLVRDEGAPGSPLVASVLSPEGEALQVGGEGEREAPPKREGRGIGSLIRLFRADVAEEEGITGKMDDLLADDLATIREESDVEVDVAVFAETLGFFTIAFSLLAIVVRLFVMYPLLTSHLGYLRTGMLHPVGMILAMGLAFVLPSVWTVLVAQAAMEGTEPMFEEGIGGTQYVLKSREYGYLQSFQLDVLLPLSSLGTALILWTLEHVGVIGDGSTWLTTGGISRPYLLLILAIFVLLLWLFRRYEGPYRDRLHRTLGDRGDPSQQSEAIDIALQPGHRHPADLILRNLPHLEHHHLLLHKSFRGLAKLRSPEAIPVLLQYTRDEHPYVQVAALNALLEFEELSHPEGVDALRRHLLETFEKATHPEVQKCTLALLGKVRDPHLVDRLCDFLRDPAHAHLCAEIITALGMTSPSPMVREVIRPFLADPSPQIRARAIVTLWECPGDRGACLAAVDRLLVSPRLEENLWGVIAVGEGQIVERSQQLLPLLLSEHRLLRLEVALSLGRLNRAEAIGPLVETICSADAVLAYYTHRQLEELDNDVEKRVRLRSEQRLSYKIAVLLERAPHEWIEEYSTEDLLLLHDYYSRMDAHAEVLLIDGVLQDRGVSTPSPLLPRDPHSLVPAGRPA